MSWEATTWARKVKGLDPTSKLVLMLLADHVSSDHEIHPSIKLLADDANVSRETVKRRIRKLAENGYITVTDRHRADGSRTSNRYRLNIDEHPPAQIEPTPAQIEPTPAHSSDPAPGSLVSHATEPPLEPPESESSDEDSLCAADGTAPRSYSVDFENFWKPIVGEKITHRTPPGVKAEAYAAWKKHRPPPDTVLDQWRAYVALCKRTDTKTKHVSRWIKYQGWEDDYGPPMSGHDMAMAALDEKWKRERNGHAGEQGADQRIGDQAAQGALPLPLGC